jgi:hypothetical protein
MRHTAYWNDASLPLDQFSANTELVDTVCFWR